MYCPTCGCQYREGFTVCSDCQIPLISDSPGAAAAKGSPDDESLVLIWSGTDPTRHTEVLESLAEENIPARTVSREEYLIVANTHQAIEVYVPSELAARAQEILKASQSEQEAWNQMAESGALEIPAEDDSPLAEGEGAEDGEDPEDGPENEDGMVEIWSGADTEMAGMIAMCLRENQIVCSDGKHEEDEEVSAEPPPESPVDPSVERLFVYPRDARRGKAIIREILGAQPPQ